MKPHEETWEKDDGQPGTIRINDVVAVQVQVTPWNCGMDLAEVERQARAVEAALLASPDITRALLRQGTDEDGAWHTRECRAAGRGCIVECQGAYYALRKAGVLP